MLHLAGADAEGQRPEGAVGGGVRVAADDRHARLGDAQLGADHVHDALAGGADRVDRHAELRAVVLERLDLHAAEVVGDLGRHLRAVGRHVVVGGGQRAVGPAHRPPGQAQGLEGLRAGDLVHQVEVDVEERVGHLVGAPDLVEERQAARGTPARQRRSPWSGPPQAGGDHREEAGLGRARVLEVVGQVGVEGHGVARGQLVGDAVADEA